MRYRKKPVVVDATNVSQAIYNAGNHWCGLPDWLREAYENGYIIFRSHCIEIKTLEGTMRADPGDWIIKGVRGELYPCKPDAFAATYEVVEE